MSAAAASASVGGPSLLARLVDGDVDEHILEEVLAELRRAGRPVPLPGLCNVLWFGRGVGGGYEGAAVSEYLDALAFVSHEPPGRDHRGGGPQDAVPLGALVKMVVGSDEAWGEVIWKEGAHPLVCPEWVPGWLSGAPSGMPYDRPPDPGFVPDADDRVLCERMVVDFTSLGEGLVTLGKLQRERRLERRLDCYGHLVAEVVYPVGLDEADEVGFWAAWTARCHAPALALAGVPAEPAALGEAASVLAAALDVRDDVRSFGPYFLDAGLYQDVLAADEADDGPLRRAVRGLAQVPHHEKVGWASMSARLADEADIESLAGPGWPLAVVSASLLTLATLAERAADGDWNGVHLRLDDPWQGGGLWRAERLDLTTPVAANPAVALGLGWVAYIGGDIERVGADDEPEPLVDEDDLSWEVTDSDVSWTTHLSVTDLDNDRLRVPARVSELIAATFHTLSQNRLIVVIRHDGHSERREWSELDGDGHLKAEWPLGVWPGTTVRVTWPLERTVVTAETTLLAEPDSVGGISYTHEFNLAVALAAAGLAEPVSRTVTISQLVRAVVRRHGQVTEDGRVALSLEDVVTYCFGPAGQTAPGYSRTVLARAVRSAVWALTAAGIASLDGELVVVSERVTGAGRQADSELLARFVQVQARRLRRAAHLHFVPATVVNLGAGYHRSADKEAQWDQVAGTDYLPDRLGPGQTWRRRHHRGSGINPALTAELQRAKEAISGLGVGEEVTASLDNAITDPHRTDAETGPSTAGSGAATTSTPAGEQP